MYCTNCGHEIPDNSAFCALCGCRINTERTVPAPEEQNAAPVVQPQKKKRRKAGLIVGISAAAAVVALVVVGLIMLNNVNKKYVAADRLFDDGEYVAAKTAFEHIATYKDSASRAMEAGYRAAEMLMQEGSYQKAQEAFVVLGGYKDSADLAEIAGKHVDCVYAEERIADGAFEQAVAILTPMAGFARADELLAEANNSIAYRDATALMDAGDMEGAAELFVSLADAGYADAAERLVLCRNHIAYAGAKADYDAGRYYTAMKAFEALGDFQDAAAKAASCVQPAPAPGAVYRNNAYSERGTSLRVFNSGSRATYIKLYIDNTLVVTMYVPGYSDASITLAKGTYSMKQAYGTTWYGTVEMFGPDGSYLASNFNGGMDTYPLTSGGGYEMRDDSTNGNVGQESVPWYDF